MQSKRPKKEPDPRDIFRKMILGVKGPDGKRIIPYQEGRKMMKKSK